VRLQGTGYRLQGIGYIRDGIGDAEVAISARIRDPAEQEKRGAWVKRRIWRAIVLVAVLAVGAGVARHYLGPIPVKVGTRPSDPAPMARWPWPRAGTDSPHPGVTHWIDRSSADGTVLELVDFDFHTNPNLRLELYDQDEDDKVPFDNKTDFWKQAVAQATRHLNETGRGEVVAAWNGLFFNCSDSVTSHVAPVVLKGKALYNVGVVRWAFGVKYGKGGPVFKVMRLPEFGKLGTEYDFAAEGASCLIREGKPLRLRRFPRAGENPFPPSEPPGPDDAGFVRRVDHIRTSRTSVAWSKDNRHLYLLIVKEPDTESGSIIALKNRLPVVGGWTVADLQRFWKSFGAWGAVNLDGGDLTQMTLLRPDGRYDLVPARWGSNRMRMVCKPGFAGAPPAGSIMYFYVRDTSNQGE